MTEVQRAHLLKRHVFGADRARLFVSDPILQGENSAHDHDFMEIALIASGSGTHVSTHGVQTVRRGDFFVLRPGAWHGYRDCQTLHVYNCCCAPELLRRELALLWEDPAITRLLWTEPLAPARRGILHRTLTEEQTQSAVAQWSTLAAFPDEPFTIRAGRLLVLLGQLGEALYPNEPHQQGAMHTAVRQGMQLLEEGYDTDWDLARLARLTRLSPSYLTRLFKAATDRAPMEYLARHRAELAANLLLATDQPVGEIGARVGWSDPNYFTRRFKSVFGVTPTAYRSQQVSRLEI